MRQETYKQWVAHYSTKKCQEVDMVPKLILLGVPNSIEEDVIKDTLDKVLSELECTLL